MFYSLKYCLPLYLKIHFLNMWFFLNKTTETMSIQLAWVSRHNSLSINFNTVLTIITRVCILIWILSTFNIVWSYPKFKLKGWLVSHNRHNAWLWVINHILVDCSFADIWWVTVKSRAYQFTMVHTIRLTLKGKDKSGVISSQVLYVWFFCLKIVVTFKCNWWWKVLSLDCK